MKKVVIIIALFTLIIIGGGIFLFSKNPSGLTQPTAGSTPTQNEAEGSYEFFWAVGCPHCQNVEDFLAGWDNRNKVTINSLEVGSNVQNAGLMASRSASCNIPQAQAGAVPMLYTPDGQCITGDTPIIDYFKSLSF